MLFKKKQKPVEQPEEDFIYAECEPYPYISFIAPGSLRNDFPGFVGIRIRVGDLPMKVTELGRYCVKECASKHILKIVTKNGFDVKGSFVMIQGGEDGQFTWGELEKPVILKPHKSYYIVSYESVNGDYWYNNDAPVMFTSDASLEGVVYFWQKWNFQLYPNTAYGPVNFKYTVIEKNN